MWSLNIKIQLHRKIQHTIINYNGIVLLYTRTEIIDFLCVLLVFYFEKKMVFFNVYARAAVAQLVRAFVSQAEGWVFKSQPRQI